MEQCDRQGEQHSTPDPPHITDGSSACTEPSHVIRASTGQDLNVVEEDVADVEAEQDSVLDSIQSNGAERLDLRLDFSTPDQESATMGDGLGDGNTSCDSGTASIDDTRTPTALPNGLVEMVPAVLDGTGQVLLSSSHFEDQEMAPSCVSGDAKEACESNKKPSHEVSPSGDTAKPQGISSQTGSVTKSDSAVSPQHADNHSNSVTSANLYDTECSRKLMSEIQHSVSQESLLDELESELLSCQVREQGSSRAIPSNGLSKDQSSMVVFEKCVQYKYSQQEKAIKRYLEYICLLHILLLCITGLVINIELHRVVNEKKKKIVKNASLGFKICLCLFSTELTQC